MLRENRDGKIKGSLRSVGDLDVEQMAAHFGGGGHRHAAGFDVAEMQLQEIYKEMMVIIKEEIQ